MSDYFEEMNFEPIAEENIENHQMLLMARFLQQYGFIDDEQSQQTAPPASKTVVDGLERRKVKITDEKCAICLKPNEECMEDTFVVLPCKHFFHDTCILPWLGQTNSCPICRFELLTDDPHYEEMKVRRQRASEREKEIEDLHNSMFT